MTVSIHDCINTTHH